MSNPTYLSPVGNDANFTATGLPASGYKLFTYQAGTTTKQVTYQGGNDGTTQNANPIILSSQGYPASGGSVVEIWLTAAQAYKFVLAPSTDTDPPSNPVWTRDNVSGINDPGSVATTQSEWVSFATAPTFVSSTSFTVSGDQRTIFQVNRRVKTTNSGGTIYSTIISSTFGASLTTVTVVNDSGALDSGLSTVSYALLAATNPSSPQRTFTIPSVCEGRLTLASGTAVTTTDQTAKTSVFFTPYKGNRVATYNGTTWETLTLTEKSVSVPATTTTPFDVFIVNETLALETVNWTNDTTRATALTTQDGVLVKNGDATRRYLGTCRTTGVSGQTEDSVANRFVWNNYNRIERFLKVVDATASWNYSTATYRQANNSSANQFSIVIGVAETMVNVRVNAAATNTNGVGGIFSVGVGIDSTTVNSAITMQFAGGSAATGATGIPIPVSAEYSGYPAVGLHFIAWLEISAAAATTTWYGANGVSYVQSGMIGRAVM